MLLTTKGTGQRRLDIEQAKWLCRENAEGAHIYLRPAGLHALSRVDDLNAEKPLSG
jgi:hypothetical protein